LGWCCIFSFDPMGAIDQFCKLVENRPGHSRSDAALEVAVRVAQGRLRTEQPPTQQTLKAFIRAVSLLEKRQPDSPEAHRLRYFLGLAFERTGRLNQAATAYGKVTPGHSNYAAAQLGQLRCHVTKIRQLSPAASADQAKLLIKQAIAQGRKRVDTLSPSDGDCVAAQIKVLLAGLYNHPAADAPQEAVDVLEDFETQHADCGNLLGTVLRERITALRQLKRLEDAREVVDQYLETDPGEAGPVMARLLDAVAQEIITARQTGDQERAEHMASEAVRLGRRLLDWSDSQAGSAVEPLSRLQIGGRYAWALLQAGKPAASLAAYQAGMDQMATLAEEVPASLRIELELGEAEALLATGEHEAALPVFMEIWRSAPEHSSIWWRAYAGSLECHAGLGHDSTTILQSIRQQRRLNPDLGGAGIKRRLSTLEKGLEAVSAVQSARPD
jgi:tetratricopeptide (TPR) repeat protein